MSEGDVATGRLQNSWTVASPNGGSEPGQANGRGDRMMWTDLALDEPAGAVVLTFRVHINEASATTTSPGGFAEALLLTQASHNLCAGSGCLATTVETLVSTQSGPAVVQDEGVVRTLRLVNQGGGNLPAGTVRVSTELYGGAFIGNYQEQAAGSSSLVTDVVWTSVEAIAEPPVAEPPPGTPHQVVVTRPYVGGGLAELGLLCQDVLPVQPAVGGACFTVPPGAVSARVSIGDLVNEPVGGTVVAMGNASGFCGASESLPLMPWEQRLAVHVDGPLLAHCGGGSPSYGSIGVVTAVFAVA